MKKETLLEIVLGTIGGLIFALGMCICLIPEWNMMVGEIIASIIGFIILLCIIPVYRKSHPKTKVKKQTDWGIIATFIIGLIGVLTMGFGMSKIMIDSASKTDMIIGLITGIIGLIVCVLNYPIYSYIKVNK